MAQINTYACDVCGEQKKPSNGWTMAIVHVDEVAFQPWDDEAADQSIMKHICSAPCESKFLMRITDSWRHPGNSNDRQGNNSRGSDTETSA